MRFREAHRHLVTLLLPTTIKDYLGEQVPGFDDHYRRAEQRAAVDPSRS